MGLTDLQIRKLAPHSKDGYEVSDGKGLSIRVTPSGAERGFSGICLTESQAHDAWLLSWAPLAVAREKHGAAMQDVQKGTDPGEQAKIAKSKRKAAPTLQGST